jgi:Flp pilus assembly protein TadG
MKRIAPRAQSGEPGQGTLEFALVVPLFLLVLLGSAEFSWALYTQNTLGHAAQEGARRGMVLTKVANAFTADGNRTGTYDPLLPCNRSTIVGAAACQLGAVNVARTTASICPSNSPTDNCPSLPSTKCREADVAVECYPPGLRVEVRLNHTYRPLILGFFPGLDTIVMTGHAEARTQ